jgi:hypothetical protein
MALQPPSKAITPVQLFSGRKRDSAVWQYFNYDEKLKKSTVFVKL